MAKKSKEELTTKMHSEFSVSDEVDLKHRVWNALDAIEENLLTRFQALKEYGVTEADVKRFKADWEELGKD